MEWAEDPLAKIECIAGDAVTELIGEEPMEESQEYPTLSKCVYICMFPLVPPCSPSIPSPSLPSPLLSPLLSPPSP